MLAATGFANTFQRIAASDRERISMHRSLDREHISKQWDCAPPTAGVGVNKQKWRKKFQNVILYACIPRRQHSVENMRDSPTNRRKLNGSVWCISSERDECVIGFPSWLPYQDGVCRAPRFSRAGDDAMPPPPTATTTSRSIPIEPKISPSTARTCLGSPMSPMSLS